ncbi:hypothetical protein IW262DRAFT_1450164 [Armillaria fumosa]|nr:hypothetical protein IW262DRAFT_1450164 [Armillaria fumosa]
MKAFVKCIFGYTGSDLIAYYGYVEVQERGTLHCHMLVWLHDIQFHDRLLQYLDEILSNSIPAEPDLCDTVIIHANQVDPQRHQCNLHNLVIDCQVHKHICCFDLDMNNTHKESSFNYETSELCLHCLDGLVNNFNETILCSVHCNMDIKFIGSRASAKAVLYYTIDYIIKSQLKTHVAYAALELSIQKLGVYQLNEDDVSIHAKKSKSQKWYKMRNC